MNDVVERAKQAINEVFSDTTVPPGKTKEALEELIDDMWIMIESLKAQMDDEKEKDGKD